MKKITTLILVCILLLSTMPFVKAEDLKLFRTYTIEEKLGLQLQEGSGFRGTITIEMQGDTLLSSMLGEGFSEAVIDLSTIVTDKISGTKQIVLDVKHDDEVVTSLTVDCLSDDKYIVSGDLVNQKKIAFQPGPLVSSLFPKQHNDEKPSWEVMLMKLLTHQDAVWKDAIEKALLPYELDLEVWLSEFAHLDAAAQSNAMGMEYLIPSKNLIAFIKKTLEQIIQDEQVLQLVSEVLSNQEIETYVNPALLETYLSILDMTRFDGDVKIIQRYGSGEESGTTDILMPMASNPYGIKSIKLMQGETETSLEIECDEITFKMLLKGNEAKQEGTIAILPQSEEQNAYAASVSLTPSQRTWTDEKGRENLEKRYQMHLAPNFDEDQMNYFDFTPIDLALTVTYRSGTAQSSPLYLTAELTFAQEDARTTLLFTGKSTSPWVTTAVSLDEATILNETELVSDLVSAIQSIFHHFTPAMKLE